MTVAKKPRSCQQWLPAWPIPLRGHRAPPPPPCCALSLGEMGALRGWGAGASWLAATQLQGLKVTLECAWPRCQVGSGFLCDLGQGTSSLAATLFCVQVFCTCQQVSRPDRKGLELDLEDDWWWLQERGRAAMGRPLGAKAR